MKQATKQRITGTVVLLALALIFLPIIFDGQGSYQAPIASRIPAVPAVPILPEPEQIRPLIIAELEQAEVATAQADDIEQDDTGVEVTTSEPDFVREVPQLDASGLPRGWSVRLGTFSEADNATGLMERLQAAGYKAYTRSISGEQGEFTGVFVGPWLERARVEDYRRRLQDEFQLSGMVERYELEKL